MTREYATDVWTTTTAFDVLIRRIVRMFSQLLSVGGLVSAIRLTPARKLLNELLPETYDTAVRPGPNGTATVVTLTLNKFILLAMDQQQESIIFSEEVLVSWIDPQLSWNRNATAYPREWIKIREMNAWVPDIIFTEAPFPVVGPAFKDRMIREQLLERASSSSSTNSERMERREVVSVEERMADLRFDGTVRVSNPSTVTYPCPLHIDSFPYDVQKCNLTLVRHPRGLEKGVARYDFATLPKRVEADDLVYWKERKDHKLLNIVGNSEWELSTILAFKEIQFDADQNETFSVVIYQVQLKRKPVYYVLVIQMPTFIMTTLTIFGIFTPFSNTEERREKVTLVLNMFVSISLMLNLVADMMPKASRLPLLGNYILSEVFVCAGALSVSLVTLVLHQRCHTRCLRPPKWIERILLCQNSTNDVHPLTTLPPPYSSTEQRPTPEIFQRSDFVEVVEQATTALKTTINRLHKKDEIRLTWIRVFDRIDLVCLLAFQLANIVCSILFMR